MDSDDSQSGAGDNSSSSSSSRSRSPARRSHSSEHIKSSPKGLPLRPTSPHTPDDASNVSPARSDIDSPRNSRPSSPTENPKSPTQDSPHPDPKSPESYSTGSLKGANSPRRARPPSPAGSPKSNYSPSSSSSNASPVSGHSPGRKPVSPGNSSPSSFENSPRRDCSPKTRYGRMGSRSKSPMFDANRRSLRVRRSHSRSASNSSRSSHSSSRSNARTTAKDPATEEISEGEMESDKDDCKSSEKSLSREKHRDGKEDDQLNISHEDLSDVSDLDSMGPTEDGEERKKNKTMSPKREIDSPASQEEVNVSVNGTHEPTSPVKEIQPTTNNQINGSALLETKMEKLPQEKTSKTEDGEEQLDFEAEEGECVEAPKEKEAEKNDILSKAEDGEVKEESADSSLEEGEVSDEGEKRPEETEPRPVCRFYSRGQCTWGISCRFLHPGVTDKGNYTMFDMVRAMPAMGGYGPPHHMLPPHLPPHHMPPHHAMHPVREPLPPTESAWERGLRTAKEMLRKANKRREQDLDFEEKRLHLSAAVGPTVGLGGDDPELVYASGAVGASPPPYASASPPSYQAPTHRLKREPPEYYPGEGYPPPSRSRGYPARERVVLDERAPYERTHPHAHDDARVRYEERAPPAGAGATAHDQPTVHKQRRAGGRSTREVIVQRARAPDEWEDPWMRGGGGRPGGPTQPPPRSRRRDHSSGSSYSSSSSSRSSSRSSHSGSRRGEGRRRISPPRQRRVVSPSVIVRERRAATARATAMNPPPPSARGRRVPSPAAARQHAANPPAPPRAQRRSRDKGAPLDALSRAKARKNVTNSRKRYSRSSSSESSSSSSESESESRSSSSTRSSSREPRRPPPALSRPRPSGKPNSGAGLSVQLGLKQRDEAADGKENVQKGKRAAVSPAEDEPNSKKSVSRREELLKQLKAVEDAIARKRK